MAYLMAFIGVWAVLGVPFAINAGNSARYILDVFLRTGVVVGIIAVSVRDVHDFGRILRVYAAGAIVFSVGATGAGGFRDLSAGGYDPNDSAMFIVSAIPLILHFMIRSPRPLPRMFYAGGLVACGSAIVLSGSRGGFVALLAVLAYSLFFLKGIRPIARAGVIAGVVGILMMFGTGEFWDRMGTITDEDDYNRHSITGRYEIWTRGVGYMAGSPVVGVGINNFSVAEGRHPLIAERIRHGQGTRYSSPHSIWVQAGAELGIPGLLAFFGMFGYGIARLWGLGRRRIGPHADPELSRLAELAYPVIGLLLGLAVAGSFLSHAYSPLLWGGFALILAFTKVASLRESHLGGLSGFPR